MPGSKFAVSIQEEDDMKKLGFLSLLPLFASLSAHATPPPTSCAQLPSRAASAVLKNFPMAHVVTTSDLTREDQEIWLKNYGSACPGWVSGAFKPGSTQYAITVVQASAQTLAQALVLIDATQTDRKPFVLSPMQDVAQVSVVRRQPGNRSRPDSVVYEAIEADHILFSWTGDGFETQLPAE